MRNNKALYLGFTRHDKRLKPGNKYRAKIRIDALWAVEITFKARSSQLVMARIDNLPGAVKALRHGRKMHVTFSFYKVIAPLDHVAKVLSILNQCQRQYGPPVANPSGTIADPLAARIGNIRVVKAHPVWPEAPQQACDRLAGNSDDPGHVGDGIIYDDINSKRAIQACRKAVNSFPGEVRFRYQLARAYDKAENTKLALRGYGAVVRKGYPQGFYSLARSYENGWGVGKNEARALALFKAAYDAGYVGASVPIANAFMKGKGGPVERKMAAAWYAAGARKGYSGAELALALLYEVGNGVPKDPEKMVELARSSALRENPNAMIMLGLIYEKGTDATKVDKKKALDWYRLAHAYGHPVAQKLAVDLAEKLGVGRKLPPIIKDVKKAIDDEALALPSDPVVDLMEATPPVVVRPTELPPPEFEPVLIAFTGLPKNGVYWLTLARPEQKPGAFLDRVAVDQFVTGGTDQFSAVPAGQYEIRVIAINPAGRKTILTRTKIAVGASRELSLSILSLMDDIDQALPHEALPPILREFAMDTAAAPTSERVREFAAAMAGEAQVYLDDAIKSQNTAALGIARVLADSAHSLAPDSVGITILAASTLMTMPDDIGSLLEAEDLLRGALVNNPDSEKLRLTLAMAAAGTGGAETALDALAPMLEDTKALMGDPAVIATLTKLFIDSGRFDQGLTLIKKITPKGPAGDKYRFYQAALLSEAGKIDEAHTVLTKLSVSNNKQIAEAANALLQELKS